MSHDRRPYDSFPRYESGMNQRPENNYSNPYNLNLTPIQIPPIQITPLEGFKGISPLLLPIERRDSLTMSSPTTSLMFSDQENQPFLSYEPLITPPSTTSITFSYQENQPQQMPYISQQPTILPTQTQKQYEPYVMKQHHTTSSTFSYQVNQPKQQAELLPYGVQQEAKSELDAPPVDSQFNYQKHVLQAVEVAMRACSPNNTNEKKKQEREPKQKKRSKQIMTTGPCAVCNTMHAQGLHSLSRWGFVDFEGKKETLCRSCFTQQIPSRSFASLARNKHGNLILLPIPKRKRQTQNTTKRTKRQKCTTSDNLNIVLQKAIEVSTNLDNLQYWIPQFDINSSMVTTKPSSIPSLGTDPRTQPNNGVFSTVALAESLLLARYGGPTPNVSTEKQFAREYVLDFVWNSVHLYVDARQAKDGTVHWTGELNHKWQNNVQIRKNGMMEIIQNGGIDVGEELFLNYGESYWTKHFFDQDFETLSTKDQQEKTRMCRIILPDNIEKLTPQDLIIHKKWWNK